MFLEMQMAAEFLMRFFQRFERHKRNAIHLRCIGVEAEISETGLFGNKTVCMPGFHRSKWEI